MMDTNDCDVSTMVLHDNKEYVIRTSRGRLLFDKYSHPETSLEQTFTLTLDDRYEQLDSTESNTDVVVPIVLATPSTSRFGLSANDVTLSSFDFLLSNNFPRTFTVKFRPPDVSESDYAWDNFQDQVIIHSRLSSLAIRLEAWKTIAPTSLSREQEESLLFPVALPPLKTPPLRLFAAIEKNALLPCFNEVKTSSSLAEVLPSFSRPAFSEHQSSSYREISPAPPQQPLFIVTAVQSQREAQEVILKLRSRRTFQRNTKASTETFPTSIVDTEWFPETEGLDANTKAELEKFNELVNTAKSHVIQETAKAKNELAYYQQLLPISSQFGSTPSQVAAKKPKKSAASKRPSKLPAILSSAASTTSLNIQHKSLLEQTLCPRRLSPCQQTTRNAKLQPLQCQTKKATMRQNSNNQQHHENFDALSDFDDSDPEIDDAPILPDDLSGVITLDLNE